MGTLICAFVAGIGVAAALFCLALAQVASGEDISFIPVVAMGAFLFLCVLIWLVALVGLTV